jgi:predicted DsbA family dithiol-disulfide isomerase
MKIDFVTDVSCAWCAIELASIDIALTNIRQTTDVCLEIQPFQLNHDLSVEGEDFDDHLLRKYNRSEAQRNATRALLRRHGEKSGFEFGYRTRIWNSFEAHRLVYWAGTLTPDMQVDFFRKLLRAHHTNDLNPSSKEVLVQIASDVGLSKREAIAVLESDRFTNEVTAINQRWVQLGINSVPTLIIDNRYILQGAQEPEELELALRSLLVSDSVGNSVLLDRNAHSAQYKHQNEPAIHSVKSSGDR